jgi:hypothetical protein
MVNPAKEMQERLEKAALLATLPTDHALLQQAKASLDHVSDKAVMDEYNRLVLVKYYRPRGFLSRLFGR